MRFVREQSKQSVVQVVDPQVYLQSVKKHLSEKQGLPAEHQRLTFTVAAAVDKASSTSPLPGSAESLLSDLDTWQALVYHNKKCLGRFIKPRLYSVSQLGDTSRAESCPVQQLSIIYDCFEAASSDSFAEVSAPIVTASHCAQYQFTVVGRCEGRNFILPATYHFSGQQAAYGLQKALYTTKHQQNKAAAASIVSALSPLITTGDLTLNFGVGLELFSAVFEPQGDSAWLKCLILKFCLVAQSSLHEAGPTRSESESSVSVTSSPNQRKEANRQAGKTQLATGSKMPSNNKSVSKNKKANHTSRTSTLSNKSSPKPTKSKELQQEGPALQQQAAPITDKAMAVPAASEDQATATNGFTSKGMLDAATQGLQSNGWALTESSSSIAGISEGAVGSWQQTAPQQQPSATEPAKDIALDLESLVSETVSQPRTLRSAHANLNGWHDDVSVNGKAASQASAGVTSQMPPCEAYPDGNSLPVGCGGPQATGMYAVPEAVHAWATDGAASTSFGVDADYAHAPIARQIHRAPHQQSVPHINGYAPGVSQAYPPHTKSGSFHPQLANVGYTGSPGSNHWQGAAPLPPPGLSHITRPRGSGWSGSDGTSSGRQAAAVRDQAANTSVGLPSYAIPAYHKQPHAQPQSHGYSGHSQHRQASAGSHARLTSNLQSLDLANDSWQSRRPGQSQNPSGQRWSRGGRPAASDGGIATQPSSARVSPERIREGLHDETNARPHVGSVSAFTGYRPHKVSAGMQHFAYPAPSAFPGAYADQGLRSAASMTRQHDTRHGNGNMKVQHDIAEAAMLPSSTHMTGSYQESRPALPDWQRPAPLQSRDLAAATDVERLLQQLTPALSSQNSGQLTLGDLWQWYLEPSLYGTEVVTLGGSRGPSVSYYVPYLSAMQLLLPMPCQGVAAQHQPAAATISFSQPQQSETSLQESDDSSNRLQQRPDIRQQAAAEPGERHQQPTSGTVDGLPRAGRVYQVKADWQSGPTQVQPLIELFDTELPFNRVPMHDKVQELAAGRLANGSSGNLLNTQPLADLHPASWYSVAWYPAYRIPDAPLNGRFLTFHHITPQHRPQSVQYGAPADVSRDGKDPTVQAEASQQSAGTPKHSVDIPVTGLKLCNLHGERWLEPLSMDGVIDNKVSQHGSQLRSNHPSQASSSVPQALQHHLTGLQQNAEYLARGQGLRLLVSEGLERLQQRHPDFEFFRTRH